MWLIPTLVTAILIYFPKTASYVFDVLTAVTVTISVAAFSYLYFSDIKANFIKEGVLLGVAWLIISVVLDIVLVILGVNKISLFEYAVMVLPLYVIIPAITIGYGLYIDQNTRNAEMYD